MKQLTTRMIVQIAADKFNSWSKNMLEYFVSYHNTPFHPIHYQSDYLQVMTNFSQ